MRVHTVPIFVMLENSNIFSILLFHLQLLAAGPWSKIQLFHNCSHIYPCVCFVMFSSKKICTVPITLNLRIYVWSIKCNYRLLLRIIQPQPHTSDVHLFALFLAGSSTSTTGSSPLIYNYGICSTSSLLSLQFAFHQHQQHYFHQHHHCHFHLQQNHHCHFHLQQQHQCHLHMAKKPFHVLLFLATSRLCLEVDQNLTRSYE